MKIKFLSALKPSRAFGGRFFLLFLVLLGILILGPFAGDRGTVYVAFRVLGFAITFLSVYALSVRRSVLIFAIALAVPAAFNRVIIPRHDASAVALAFLALTFSFDIFVVVSIFLRVFSKPKITTETILGALCVYLLVGFAFSNLYLFLSRVQPSAFYLSPLSNLHATPDSNDFAFYSFATLTSLGANGITPVTGQARSFSVLEAILGVLYLAVLVAKLIASYRPDAED